MGQYDTFARFYDSMVGDRSEAFTTIKELLRGDFHKIRSVLELGCGTGTILREFPKRVELVGIDHSAEMLRVAKHNVPRATLIRGDISKVELPRRFDLVYCVFDTINHLLTFKEWQSVFSKAAKHLNSGGVFLFDFNTLHKLKRYSTEPPWVRHMKRDVSIMTVRKVSPARFRWRVEIFEAKKGNMYTYSAEDIHETSFPLIRIKGALVRDFASVHVHDPRAKSPHADSLLLYVRCRKKKKLSKREIFVSRCGSRTSVK